MLKIQQRFKKERLTGFNEEINKIALSSVDDEKMKSIDSTEANAHGTRKDLVSKKEEIKCNNTIKQYKNV